MLQELSRVSAMGANTPVIGVIVGVVGHRWKQLEHLAAVRGGVLAHRSTDAVV